jgi:hypothetical protein
VEPIEQRLHVGVLVEIQILVRVSIARQEVADAQRVGRVHRSDQRRVPDAARHQLDAAQDERAHEDLAQLGVGLYERDDLLARQLDHLAVFARADREHPAASGDHVHFAGELSRRLDRDDDVAGRAVASAHDLEDTRLHQVEMDRRVAGVHQDLAGPHGARAAVRLDTRHLRRRQRRKDVLVPRGRDRERLRVRFGHPRAPR